MMTHKLSIEPESKLRLGLTLENQIIKSEKKDPKMEEIRKFAEIAKNMPDLRENKVKAIKRQLQSGKYKVSPEAVVESFIELYTEIFGESV